MWSAVSECMVTAGRPGVAMAARNIPTWSVKLIHPEGRPLYEVRMSYAPGCKGIQGVEEKQI